MNRCVHFLFLFLNRHPQASLLLGVGVGRRGVFSTALLLAAFILFIWDLQRGNICPMGAGLQKLVIVR